MDNYYYQPPGAGDSGSGGDFGGDSSVLRRAYFLEKAKYERREIRKLGNSVGLAATAYIIVQLIFSYVIMLVPELYDKYQNSALFQMSSTAIFVELFATLLPFAVLALVNKKKYETPLIPAKRLPFSTLLLWTGFGLFCCLCADYLITVINTLFQSIGHSLESPEYSKPDSAFAVVVVILCNTIIPAICEEFSFRCCTLGLLKKYGKGFGVLAVSIMFGLFHGNLIQFIFATLVGLILGFVTVKTDSILPAVLIHAINNILGVLGDAVSFFFNEKAESVSYYFSTLFWIIFGAICLVILAVKGQFRRGESSKEFVPFGNSVFKKLVSFFFVPGMIVPFAFLLLSIFSSIK